MYYRKLHNRNYYLSHLLVKQIPSIFIFHVLFIFKKYAKRITHLIVYIFAILYQLNVDRCPSFSKFHRTLLRAKCRLYSKHQNVDTNLINWLVYLKWMCQYPLNKYLYLKWQRKTIVIRNVQIDNMITKTKVSQE